LTHTEGSLVSTYCVAGLTADRAPDVLTQTTYCYQDAGMSSTSRDIDVLDGFSSTTVRAVLLDQRCVHVCVWSSSVHYFLLHFVFFVIFDFKPPVMCNCVCFLFVWRCNKHTDLFFDTIRLSAIRDVKVSIPTFWSRSRSRSRGNWSWSRPRSYKIVVSVSYVLVSWSQIDFVFLKCNDF